MFDNDNRNNYTVVCKASDAETVIAELQNIINIYVFNSCSHDSARIKAANYIKFTKNNIDYIIFELATWKSFVYSEDFANLKHDSKLRNRTEFLLKELRMLVKLEKAKIYYPLTVNGSINQNSIIDYLVNNSFMKKSEVQLVDEVFIDYLSQLLID